MVDGAQVVVTVLCAFCPFRAAIKVKRGESADTAKDQLREVFNHHDCGTELTIGPEQEYTPASRQVLEGLG